MNEGSWEVELKWRLDGLAEYERLAGASTVCGEWSATIRQENHFFDTADRRLDAARYVLRLRVTPSTSVLTVKGPAQGAAKPEVETEITSAVKEAILAGERDFLDTAREGEAALSEADRRVLDSASRIRRGAPLLFQGTYVTERRTASLGGRGVEVELALDQTTFPGNQVHYELEAELTSHGDLSADDAAAAMRRLVEPVLRDAGLTHLAPGGQPKIARFFAALDRQAG